MSRFAKLDSALALALSQVKDDIKTAPAPAKPVFKREQSYNAKRAAANVPETQKINGHIVRWETTGDRKIPIIQNDQFYIQYPSKADDVKDVPVGCVRATYNAEAGCVEYYTKGAKEPMKRRYNQKFSGLPYPRFMSGLETVEEIVLCDLETGEITIEVKVDVLDEYSHWLLRLQEYEAQSLARGISKFVIDKRMAGFIKNLKATRGVDLLDKTNKIPPNLLSAIEFVKQKQAVR
jgi:hypothetical protein